MNSAFIFILGLLFGSFLNVVSYRLAVGKSFIFGRSFCPDCKKEIKWHDNIPLVSFLILKGKCRHCRKKISLQYPALELAAGLIFLLLFYRFGLGIQFIAYAVISCFLIVIFIHDLKTGYILDKVSLPAIVIAFLFSLYFGLGLLNILLGALIGAGFFGAQFLVSKGKWVGDGDIRLGALMGVILGWKYVLVALFIAYILGAIVGLVVLALGKKKLSSQIPFGPFLVAGTFLALLYGREILNWYLNLIYL